MRGESAPVAADTLSGMPERDLFANFERMRRDMDELFGDMLDRSRLHRRRHDFSPAVDVAYCSDPPRAVVIAELAGVGINRLELEIQGRRLILSGQRESPVSESEVYQQVEIERGRFRRIIELGVEVRSEEVTARYEDGMLRVELPLLSRDASPRHVPIESGERE